MVSAVIWYGYIGMNAVVRLDDIVEDPRLIQMYHQMNALLPFTAGLNSILEVRPIVSHQNTCPSLPIFGHDMHLKNDQCKMILVHK